MRQITEAMMPRWKDFIMCVPAMVSGADIGASLWRPCVCVNNDQYDWRKQWLAFGDIWPWSLTFGAIFVFLDKKIACNLQWRGYICKVILHCHRRAIWPFGHAIQKKSFPTGVLQKLKSYNFSYFTCNHARSNTKRSEDHMRFVSSKSGWPYPIQTWNFLYRQCSMAYVYRK